MADRSSAGKVRGALATIRSLVPVLALLSGVVNVLALTGSLYMLQVYDRVLSSRSVSTLVALSILVAGLYLFQGVLELLRGQVLVRIGSRFDRQVSPLAHGAVMRLPLVTSGQRTSLQPIRDVESVRGFLGGQGPVAILDMPWMPLYVAFAYFLHPVLGFMTLAGALVLIVLTLITEHLVRKPSEIAAEAARERYGIAEASERNAEAVKAMGFADRMLERFAVVNARHLKTQELLSDIVGGFSTASRIFRLVLQSALLGTGAYLVLGGELTAGAIIAGSIAASRALAPIEIAISQWRNFVGARQAAHRLEKVLGLLPADIEPLKLPAPTQGVSLDNVTVTVPGTQRVIVANATMEVKAGQVVAVVGPSAAGKSTLARAIAGVWPVARGTVRLDGATLDRWAPEDLGRHIGYVPQSIQLFSGTITENITRFDPNPDSGAVIAAAQAADVHELILRLPNGYETQIGDNGEALSEGQRQRIALARALYNDPFLLVLDEPNSNLDAEGETALQRALVKVKQRGGIAIVVAHRPSVLAAVDLVAAMSGGQIRAFGPRDEVLRKVLQQPPQAAPVPQSAQPPATATQQSAPQRPLARN